MHNNRLRLVARKKWVRYESIPSEKNIQLINEKYLRGEKEFSFINIAELLLCANNEKDSRGPHKDLPHITSTGKKILNILLLGRILDRQKKDGCLCATDNDNDFTYKYLSNFNASLKKVKFFYYVPGRTISVSQLKKVGTLFENRIEETALVDGLDELVRCELVTCVDRENKLYKLNFDGCKKFLDSNIVNKQ